MIVNIDRIHRNKKAIAGKEYAKVTDIKDQSLVVMFLSITLR